MQVLGTIYMSTYTNYLCYLIPNFIYTVNVEWKLLHARFSFEIKLKKDFSSSNINVSKEINQVLNKRLECNYQVYVISICSR